jgi:hypothetical protein
MHSVPHHIGSHPLYSIAGNAIKGYSCNVNAMLVATLVKIFQSLSLRCKGMLQQVPLRLLPCAAHVKAPLLEADGTTPQDT